MTRLVRLMCVLMIVAALAIGVSAQSVTPPPSINVALQQLSTYLGFPITLNDLDTFNWQGARYLDSALGCNLIAGTPIPESIVGYTFFFTYNGTTYEFRASEDSTLAFPCDVNLLEQGPAISAQATAAAAQISACPPAFPGYLRPRLRAGIQAGIDPNGTPNRLRELPSLNSVQIGIIEPGAVVDVLAGPSCESQAVNGQANIVFFQVRIAGQVGWTAEGLPPASYYLAPIGDISVTLSAERSLIAPSNVLTLARLGSVMQPAVIDMDIAPEGESGAGVLVALGSTGGEFYNLVDFAPLGTTDEAYGTSTAIALSPDGRYLAFGFCEGRFGIIDTTINSVNVLEVPERGCVTDLAFDPNALDGLTLAVGFQVDNVDGSQTGKFVMVDAVNAQLGEFLISVSSPAIVTAVAYSADGATVSYLNDALHVVNAETLGEQGTIALEATNPIGVLAYRPLADANAADTQIAYGEGFVVNLINPLSGVISLFELDEGMFPTAIAFSNTGSLMAVAVNMGDVSPILPPSLLVFDVETGDVIYQAPLVDNISALAFTPDGTLLIVASGDELLVYGIV